MGSKTRWLGGVVAVVVVAVVIALIAGASSSSSSSHALTMESSQEATLIDNFNPFVSTVVTSIGAPTLIYESLLQFDIAKPLQAPYDFLATGYKWGAGGRSITFTIRNGVKWSNGTALTPADVASSYDMVGRYADINANGLKLATPAATVSGDDVTVNFTSPSYVALQYIGTVPIVPQAIWSKVGDPGKYADTNPVGSGPYTLSSYSSSSGIVLKANAKYWGGPWATKAGPPAVGTVEFPTYTSAESVLSALDDNSLDWAGNFITALNPAFTSGKGHAVWFAPVNTNSLIPNLRSWPMNQLAVRQAVSLAIDRNNISATGESGLEPPATNASGIVLPNFASQEAPAVTSDTLSGSASAAAADKLLTSAGYTLDGGGYYALNGKEVDITITDPADYADYDSDDTIIAQDLQQAHINAKFQGVADAAWYSALADGQFGSATSHWSNSAITVWGLYDGWLDSTLNNGQGAGDFEGLKNPAIDADLTTLAGASSAAEIKAAAAPIEQYVATNLPIIPTVYGASFDEYNTSSFSGWPNASDEYESGSPNTPTNEVIVLHLKPVK